MLIQLGTTFRTSAAALTPKNAVFAVGASALLYDVSFLFLQVILGSTEAGIIANTHTA